ncbi:MAG: SAM-dependent methyltransferase [Alkalispirochaetaceae bacterium]
MNGAKQADQVRTYYDRNTRRFLAHGEGGKELAIRRSVWAPEVREREEAMQYVNRRIVEEMEEIGARGAVDLGCGVGGSILYVASRRAGRYTGVTLSPVQAQLGRRVLEERPGTTIRVGDFSERAFWSSLDHPVDLAFAVESMVHVPRIEELFEAARETMPPGSRFVIVDDFLAEREPGTKRERRWLREFREGWRAAGLRRVSDLERIAGSRGFRLLRGEDFTPFLEIDRPRDLAARLFIMLFRWWPGRGAWFSNLYGGNALQLCLKNGVIQYRYLVLERSRRA